MSLSIADVINTFGKIALWTSLVPIAVGVFRFRQLSKGLVSIFVLAGISLISDLLIHQYSNLKDVPSFVGRIFTVSEFALISIFFFYEFSRKPARRIVAVLALIFIVIAVIDFVLQGVMLMDNLSMTIESIVFLTYSMVLFYFMLKDMIYPNILQTSQFWIIAGILVYFGGCIFIFICSNYLSREMVIRVWGIHNLLVIAYNVLISIGLWKARKQYR